MNTEIFLLAERVGIVAFGISGFLLASNRHLDIYGALVLAFVTALGGGIVRDLLLGATPPSNLISPISIVLATAPALLLWLLRLLGKHFAKSQSQRMIPFSYLMLLADTLGLAAFTVSGVLASYSLSEHITLSIFCGVITATGGGMLRDLLAGDVPVVLRREIYAVASLLGASIMTLLLYLGFGISLASLVGLSSTITIRIGSHILQLHLPKL